MLSCQPRVTVISAPVERRLRKSRPVLDEAAQTLQGNPEINVQIEGHTDSTGPDLVNQTLGEERATAVRNYLHDQHGIALSRMAVISYGKTRPIVDNKTNANRAQNRRVVIKVLE